MAWRALLAIVVLIATFVVPGTAATAHVDAVGVSAAVEVAHVPGTTTRTTAHPLQQRHPDLGRPLDGVHPPVHVTPDRPVRADVVDPAHAAPDEAARSTFGDRAPPPTSGS
ncbi:hypothetical protein GCM10022243_60830 [Saccharothrix violaceirubra]|uniref:Secreted protein n=1 Tax=Saccharothrix violaceirubra TaxID=413306 RepID=A0A7W7WY23_9PSEU|nr:hypothetical protein [Saccharothrix violaceirubra]MBB4968059.1 hypothetical protein [Saccharothrix violaceirubra]